MKHHMQDMGYMEDVKLDDNEAMEFHYFKLHDTDNNNKLDGLELAAAITHYHEPGEEGKHQAVALEDEELGRMLDQILKEDDINMDGYVDYYEFKQAQKKT